MKRRAALLWNRTAGRGRRAELVESVADTLSVAYDVERRATESVDEGLHAVRQVVADGLDALFVLGGDGSLRLAAAELLGTPIALGPLPGGTTNVVVRALGLPTDPLAAARELATGRVREIDVGRAGDGLFLMQVSGGLDARVMAAVDPRWKRRFGRLAIAWTALREWARYRFPLFTLEIDGQSTTAAGFVVANLAEYAGALRIVPEARPDDRQLDLLLFRGRRRRHALGFALDLARGRHGQRHDVSTQPIDRVRVVGPERLELQSDGDPLTDRSPFELRISSRRLRVLSPQV